MSAITDAWKRAEAAASRDPLTKRDLAEAIDALGEMRDAMQDFSENQPESKPVKIHISGENYNRQFKDADAMAAYIVKLMETK